MPGSFTARLGAWLRPAALMLRSAGALPPWPWPLALRSAYLRQVKLYQLRQWGCCYTGATGLTYEEALLSERRVEAVTSQVRPPAAAGRGPVDSSPPAAARPVHPALRAAAACYGPPQACEGTAAAAAAVPAASLPATLCLLRLLHPLPCPAPPLSTQFPKLYEAEAVRLVHHSVETAEQLAGSILAHLAVRFVQVRPSPASGQLQAFVLCCGVAPGGRWYAGVQCKLLPLLPPSLCCCCKATDRPALPVPRPPHRPHACPRPPQQGEELVGTRADGSSCTCIVREVQLPAVPAKENGAAVAAAAGGSAGGGDDSEATDDEDTEEEGDEEVEEEEPPVDPDAVVYVVEWLGEGGAPSGTRDSLRRGQLARPPTSPLAALEPQLLQRWVETVATAEPVAVRFAGAAGLWRGMLRGARPAMLRRTRLL